MSSLKQSTVYEALDKSFNKFCNWEGTDEFTATYNVPWFATLSNQQLIKTEKDIILQRWINTWISHFNNFNQNWCCFLEESDCVVNTKYTIKFVRNPEDKWEGPEAFDNIINY